MILPTLKETNKIAQNIAKFWFENRQERTTPAIFSRTIAQAKTLLNAGYSEEEIRKVILYLLDNPPKNGLSSLGYLSYVMNDTLKKVKIQEVKQEIRVSENKRQSGLLKIQLDNEIIKSKSIYQERFF